MRKFGYEIRLYPNASQMALINMSCGCSRWVYNKALALKQLEWNENQNSLSVYDLVKQIPKWKKEFEWLKTAESTCLQQAIRDMGCAYKNFFDSKGKSGFPKFKSKHTSKQTFRVTNGDNKRIQLGTNVVKLPKLGTVKARTTREITGRILNATIKHTSTGKYFCVLQVEEELPSVKPAKHSVVGIDTGIKDVAVDSRGHKYGNPGLLKKYEKKLKREQRRLSKKQGAKKGEAKSNNFVKQKIKVARYHEKIKNTRKDNLHKISSMIVSENQTCVMEDLNVAGMLKNHHWARCLSNASIGELIRQIQYKCEWYGRDFVQVDRFFPSSKLCHCCGSKNTGLKLAQRKWTCDVCSNELDRDINAAINIENEGIRILNEINNVPRGIREHEGTSSLNACGDTTYGGSAYALPSNVSQNQESQSL